MTVAVEVKVGALVGGFAVEGEQGKTGMLFVLVK
jgi:hypothetical protein